MKCEKKKFTQFVKVIVITISILIITSLINYVDYKSKIVEFVYPIDNYDEIQIPSEIKVIFVKGVPLLMDYYPLFYESYIGRYYPYKKEIKIMFNMSNEQIKRTLIHEIAHHYYYYNLSKNEKDVIKEKYKDFCSNVDEFYAETIENYGKFNYY